MVLLWTKVATLDSAYRISLNRFYCENNFQIEVRRIFADVIEQKIIENGLDEGNPEHHPKIIEFLGTTLANNIVSRLAGAQDAAAVQQKMRIMLHQLRTKNDNNLLLLFSTMKSCLKLEESYLDAQLRHNNFTSERENIRASFLMNIKTNISSENRNSLHQLDQLHSDFMFDVRQRKQAEVMLNQLMATGNNAATQYAEQCLHLQNQLMYYNNKIQDGITTLVRLAQTIEQNLSEEINLIAQFQNEICEELTQWKREQKLQANKEKIVSTLTLDKLQEWCEELACVIWNTCSHIKKIEKIKNANPIFQHSNIQNLKIVDTIPDLLSRILDLLRKLLVFSFVVEEQPPQSIRQTTKIQNSIKVRHLCGHKLSAHMTPPKVEMYLIDEAMVTALMANSSCERKFRATVTADPRALEYDNVTKNFSTTFKNAQLKGFRRSEKKGGNSSHRVMEDKFCFYFETDLEMAGMTFTSWTISHPIVITSHGSQDPLAAATIIWDNAFAEFTREPFVVPDQVTWTDLAEVLKCKFASCTGTKGRRLTDVQIQILKAKLNSVNGLGLVTWQGFSKENMPKPSGGKLEFSFWNWCFEAMNLIENYLKEAWCDGSIIGIIDKETVQQNLASCEPGTFLVRFCDSILGAVSVSWVDQNGIVKHGEPYTENHLKICGLADRIIGSPAFTVLYPTMIPKEDAFKIYCNAASAVPAGYVQVPTTPITNNNINEDHSYSALLKSFDDSLPMPDMDTSELFSSLMNGYTYDTFQVSGRNGGA